MTEEEVWKAMGVISNDSDPPMFSPEAKKEAVDAIEEGLKLIAIFASIFGSIFLFLVICS